jgi:hypothetical protein
VAFYFVVFSILCKKTKPMKKTNLIALAAFLMLTACSSDNEYFKNENIVVEPVTDTLVKPVVDTVKVQDPELLKNEESKNLEKMYAEIVALSENTKTCTNNSEWDFVPVGLKPCGEPNEYLIYSSKINTTDFLAKIRTYNTKQEEFNTKWKINSTCDVVPEPASIDCVDGKPTLIYKPQRDLEEQDLEKMHAEIVVLSDNTKSCVDNNDWDFTSLGSNSCGGTREYIIYSQKINTSDFFKKINIYNNKQKEFNTKWKINSTCEVALQPASVDCVNGKPTLIYASDRTTEKESLEKLYKEIIELSLVNTQECTNAKEWAFISLGNNPCGGPVRYIPYSLKINVADFINKIYRYDMAEMNFNKRWKLIGMCAIPNKPSGIECNNGKATLTYPNHY